MLHIDVSDDVECGLFQGKVELATSARAKPKDGIFQYSMEDGLKIILALHKSQNWKRRARSLGRYCFLVFIT